MRSSSLMRDDWPGRGEGGREERRGARFGEAAQMMTRRQAWGALWAGDAARRYSGSGDVCGQSVLAGWRAAGERGWEWRALDCTSATSLVGEGRRVLCPRICLEYRHEAGNRWQVGEGSAMLCVMVWSCGGVRPGKGEKGEEARRWEQDAKSFWRTLGATARLGLRRGVSAYAVGIGKRRVRHRHAQVLRVGAPGIGREG